MVSIITVCFNDAKNLEKTILSVLKQKNANIEFIVKDAKSKDNTDEVIEKYRKKLEEKLKFIYISEVDGGLYDAMNIATDIATGDRVLYLNSGDCLYDENTIFNVDNYDKDTDIIYGDTIYVCGNRQNLSIAPEPEDVDIITIKRWFAHQAAFIKTSVMKELKYDLNYKLCADYDFFVRASLMQKSYKHINCTVVYFALGGLSHQRIYDLNEEVYTIEFNHKIINKIEYEYLINKNQRKRYRMSFIPKKIFDGLRNVKLRYSTRHWDRIIKHERDC